MTLVVAAAVITAAAAAGPPVARAEPFPTPQQQTYRADWVEGLRAEDLSPSRAVVCIVDSGVAVTPDTPADDPSGPVLLRTSITPETMPGTPPPGSDDAAIHGTLMAAAAIAPRNAWGTVGLNPLGRVISIRALRDGQTTFDADAVRMGLSRCRQGQAVHRIAAVDLSLGSAATQDPSVEQDYTEEVERARQQGIAIVGAAGNVSGSTTQFPARVPGVAAVGAANSDRRACSYATDDDRVDIFGPGCGVLAITDIGAGTSSMTDDAGSSMAALWFAGAIGLLCDLVPSLTGTKAQEVLIETARAADGRRVLDVEAAARAAGAGAIVDRARGRLRTTPAVSPPVPSAARRSERAIRFTRFTAAWSSCRLAVVVKTNARGWRARVDVLPASGTRAVLHRTTGGEKLLISMRPRVVRVRARFLGFASQASQPIERIARPHGRGVRHCVVSAHGRTS